MSKLSSDKEYNRLRYSQKRKANPRHRASILLCGARRRSLKIGMECTLDIDWIQERILGGKCEVTGIPFKMDYPYAQNGCGQQQSLSPSLDRTDPKRGYTKDNVKVVVWVYNAAKGVGGHEDVMILARALCGL